MDILCFLVLLLSRENQGNNVARSYIKTKYKALTYGTTEILWIRFLLSDLWLPSVSTITLWCDNLVTTYLSINFFFYAHTKHVEVVANQEIQIHFISSENQLGHVLTKPLSFAVFVRFLSKLHVGALFSA